MRDIMLMFHFVGVAMALGYAFSQLFFALKSLRMTTESSNRFMLHSINLNWMGTIGILIILVSGSFLGGPFWENMHLMPTFSLKLTLVLIFILLLIIQSILGKTAKKVEGKYKRKILWMRSLLGFVLLGVGLTIIYFAVMTFH